MAKEDPQPKVGAGHAEAMFRQGLSELRGALYNESNVAQPPQLGLVGTRTPGEIAEARSRDALDRDEEPGSVLGERLKAAEREQPTREPEPPGMERD